VCIGLRTSDKISKLYIKLLKIKHEIYKYTGTIYNCKQYTKLLFKIYVKLTLQCHSNCPDVKEDLKSARELKSSVSCGGGGQRSKGQGVTAGLSVLWRRQPRRRWGVEDNLLVSEY